MLNHSLKKGILFALLGSILGGTVAILVSALLIKLFFLGNNTNGWAELSYGILFIILLYPLGAAAGAAAALRFLNYHPTFWKLITAAYLSEILVLLLAEPLHLNLNPTLLVSLMLLLPIGSVLSAFMINLRYSK